MHQMLNSAILLATVAHDGQYDKAGKPYILHVMRVMQNLNSSDEELNCIAILHDTIEDTADHKVSAKRVTYEILRQAGMSERVVAGVKLLTKVPGQTADEYLQGILSSKDACLVKKADLTDNMDLKRLKGVSEKDMTRMNKYVLSYHEIETALANFAEAASTAPTVNFVLVEEPQTMLRPVMTGDVVRFAQSPRNANGHAYITYPDFPFVLGKELKERTPGDRSWTAFAVDGGMIGDAMWGWVRSDDLEFVG